MDADRFDIISRSIAMVPPRRALLGLALGGVAGALGWPDAHARKRRRKKKKIKRNAFGCVNVGNFCKNAGQCCSGICTGKKGKKRCRAHDSGECLAGVIEEFCGGPEDIACTTTVGLSGLCETTTGDAAYCVHGVDCFPCQRDADCLPFCGDGAACLKCAGCAETGGTTCGSIGPEFCAFPPA